MKIERFEDIKAWQEAREIVRQIYCFTGKEYFKKDFGLRDQIQRASVSIMANIAEGFDSKSKLEFIRFLTFARRSGSEAQSRLYVALDQDYISKKEFEDIYLKIGKAKNLIGGFIRYLHENKQ